MYKRDRYKNENNNNVSTILIIIQQNFLNIDNLLFNARYMSGEERREKKEKQNK